MPDRLETQRLVIRRFRASDLTALSALNRDREVMRYITGRPTPAEEVRDQLLPRYLADQERSDGPGHWAADERATGMFVGWFALRAWAGQERTLELGYRLRRDAWGRGLATEGGLEMLRLAFTTLGADRVTAQTMTVNGRSRRVMERIGLRFVRTFHAEWSESIEGSEQGDVEYALDRDAWVRSGAGQTPAG
jgi:RimJ/RimL family protein N-acetyltransferase